MPAELTVHVIHEGGMCFTADAGEHTVTVDYPIPAGADTSGMTPLQLILTSLAACAGSTLTLVLKRMSQAFEGLEVTARGQRREEHPTVLTEIELEFLLRGSGIDPEAVRRALQVTETQLCPVWAMLKPGTPITASFKVVGE